MYLKQSDPSLLEVPTTSYFVGPTDLFCSPPYFFCGPSTPFLFSIKALSSIERFSSKNFKRATVGTAIMGPIGPSTANPIMTAASDAKNPRPKVFPIIFP